MKCITNKNKPQPSYATYKLERKEIPFLFFSIVVSFTSLFVGKGKKNSYRWEQNENYIENQTTEKPHKFLPTF